MEKSIAKRIGEEGAIAVVVLDRLEDAMPLVNALQDGGVNAIELTLRTPVALEAARQIKNEAPDMLLGLGTVLTTDQVAEAADVGVDFAVAPGCNPKIVEAAQRTGLYFSPGVMTPTDIEIAVELGCRVLKFFPAATSGGLNHLNSMAAPYLHLGLQFIPLGGVNQENASTYLSSPLITAVGGSWIAKRGLINAGDWSAITDNAVKIRETINALRS